VNEVEELATFDYPNGRIEVLSSPHWQGIVEGVRVLRSDPELTGFDFILIVPEPYVRSMRDDTSILLFLWTMKELGGRLLTEKIDEIF